MCLTAVFNRILFARRKASAHLIALAAHSRGAHECETQGPFLTGVIDACEYECIPRDDALDLRLRDRHRSDGAKLQLITDQSREAVTGGFC